MTDVRSGRHEQTFGEMEPLAKHKMSHRADASASCGGRSTNEPPLALTSIGRFSSAMPLLRLQQPRPAHIDKALGASALPICAERGCCRTAN